MVLSEKQKELIERIGVFHEHKGMQPLVGRIIGFLLVHENGAATFDEIVDQLGVSKSAVSNALTFLQAKDRCIYTTRLGDRKRYFSLKANNWREEFEKELLMITQVKEFIDEVLEYKDDHNQDYNCSLKDFSKFLEFFKREVPLLFEKFKKENT